MKQPLVSIIIPGFNMEPYMQPCLDSLERQTYKNIEVIFIDDGSKDRTGEIMRDFANMHKNCVVISQENAGLSEARNRGIEIAKGDYITFLDSDDSLEGDAIEYLVELAEKHSCKISITPHYEDREGVLTDFNRAGLKTGVWDLEKAFDYMLNEHGTNLQVASKMFARSLFEGNRFQKGKLHEDVGMVYKLFLACDTKIAFGAKPKYKYFIRSNSITNSGFNWRKVDDLISQTDEMCDAIDERFEDLRDSTELRRMHARFSILRMVCVLKDKGEKEKSLEAEMAKYLKEHADWVMKNPKAGRRDKLAMASLRLGRGFFAFAWKAYERLVK